MIIYNLLVMRKLLKVEVKYFSTTIDMNQIKNSKMTKMSNRSLLIVNGPDSHKLLQGLMTNDIRELKQVKHNNDSFNRIALYTLFLQPKGKVIADAFIFKPRIFQNGKAEYSKDQLWIDVDQSVKKELKDHIKRHMWKKQAELHDTEQDKQQGPIPTIYLGYNQESVAGKLFLGGSIELPELQKGEDDTYANLIYYDPRGPRFGVRIVSNQEEMNIESIYQKLTLERSNKLYETLGQSPLSLSRNKLPFQFNYDLMNAISLKKGCYIGQQIVSRGLQTGIIRKRVFPFKMGDKNGIYPQIGVDTILKGQKDQQIGKVLSYSGGSGLVLMNYLKWLERRAEWPISIISPEVGTVESPLADKIDSYYSEMKAKQIKLQELDL